jgi:beta-lactamase class D
VEHREGAVFFALNIDMPDGAADLPKRERIVRAILRELGALPGDAAR